MWDASIHEFITDDNETLFFIERDSRGLGVEKNPANSLLLCIFQQSLEQGFTDTQIAPGFQHRHSADVAVCPNSASSYGLVLIIPRQNIMIVIIIALPFQFNRYLLFFNKNLEPNISNLGLMLLPARMHNAVASVHLSEAAKIKFALIVEFDKQALFIRLGDLE